LRDRKVGKQARRGVDVNATSGRASERQCDSILIFCRRGVNNWFLSPVLTPQIADLIHVHRRELSGSSTSEMRESSGVSDGKLARRLTGKATSWACAEPVALLPQAPRGNKANVTAPEMLDSAFRQNFDEILPGI
jgi:hypothetical protein